MALIERFQLQLEAGRALVGAQDLHPSTTEDLHTAEGRQAAIGAGCWQDGLLSPSMPYPADVGVGIKMGLVLMMEFVMRQIGGHVFFPPPPGRLHTWRLRRHAASAAR